MRLLRQGQQQRRGRRSRSTADPDAPVVAMAFKLVEESFGQLTYTRVYQGRLREGHGSAEHADTRKAARVGRMVRMHANDREDMDEADAGRHHGLHRRGLQLGRHLLRRPGQLRAREHPRRRSRSSRWRSPRRRTTDRDKLAKALHRFVQRRPDVPRPHRPGDAARPSSPAWANCTSKCTSSASAASTGCAVTTGAPHVNYREAPTRRATFNYKHKKQTGGSGQYAHVIGRHRAAARERGGDVRIRQRGRRRAHPDRVHPVVRQGLPAGADEGAAGRLRGRPREGRPGGRHLSRGGLVGSRVPDRGARCVQARRIRGRGRRSSSRS